MSFVGYNKRMTEENIPSSCSLFSHIHRIQADSRFVSRFARLSTGRITHVSLLLLAYNLSIFVDDCLLFLSIATHRQSLQRRVWHACSMYAVHRKRALEGKPEKPRSRINVKLASQVLLARSCAHHCVVNCSDAVYHRHQVCMPLKPLRTAS